MRDNTKIIMLITALAFVALMVFEWGMDMSGQNSAQFSGGEIGEIDGVPILYEEYSRIYQQLYQQQAQQQDGPLTSAQTRQIEDAAFEQVVSERLIQREIERRGLRATPEEIRQAARYSPPPEFYTNELFLTDGQFDLQKYHEFLASPAINNDLLLQLEQYYREAIPRSKLFRQVVSGIFVTDPELWRMWRDRNEKVAVEYLALDPDALVPDAGVSVTEEEIRAYYDEHQDELRRPARASVEIVALPKAPPAEDSTRIYARARAVREEILGGRDFAEAAEALSDDAASAAQGGSLGTIARGQTVPAFERAAFSLPIGELSEPVLSPYGYHLIRVESRGGDTAQVRHILFEITRGEETEDLLLERADSLERIGEERGLRAAAEALGLGVRQYQLSEGTPFVPGIGAVDEGEDWAFGAAERGATSPVFENEDTYYMLRLTQRTPEGVMPFEETREALRERVLEQKKLERTRAIAREVIDRVRGGSTLAAEAARLELDVQQTDPFARIDFVPGLGAANAAIGTAFGLETGQIGGPAEANGQVYVLRVTQHLPADRDAWEAQKQEQRQRVIAALEQSRVAQFLADLRERADIVDNRDAVLRAPTTAAN